MGTTVVAGDADGVVVPVEHGVEVGVEASVTPPPEQAVAAMSAITTADILAVPGRGRVVRSGT